MKFVKDDKRKQVELEKRLRKMQTLPHVAVGILQDTPVSDEFSMVDLALVHEYGSSNGHIPARSFFSSTLDANKAKYTKLMAKLQDTYVAGKSSMHQALTRLGSVVAGDIVTTINRGIKPRLKQKTINRKKSSKPLIATGRLKGSITHEVRGAL